MTDSGGDRHPTAKRERSTIGFPYGDLNSATRVARALHGEGGGYGELDQLAAWLDYSSIDNGAFRQQLSTARTFGLTESARGSVSLTQLGHSIVDPTGEARARIEAFLHVPLYGAVYERFRGRTLPADSGLENVFASLGVAEKQTDRARHAFQRSAEQAGFFGAGKDRLVEPSPASLNGGHSADSDPEPRPAAPQPPLTPDEAKPEAPLHPFIQGLIATLPDPGTAWSDPERKEWLTAAEHIFALIYKAERKQLPQSVPDTVEQATA